ncbi:MAG: carbamoyltransferase [Chloroflexi bacterium]|nr:carbamoyltransferase [Chloroflexota bacterium]
MYILGISCFYHDSAAALLKDGVLIAAAEEERFSRKKHDSGYPTLAVAYCLEEAGITPEDLDYVVFYEKPLPKFERLLTTALATWPKSTVVFREAMITWLNEKLWIKDRIRKQLAVPMDKVLFVEHHLSHAASAFFCSPYEESAVLTVDGVGEWTSATLGMGKATWDGSGTNSIELFQESRFPHSLGLYYSAFTAWLGFEVNDGEYKVMGMAPYGRPNHQDKVRKVIDFANDGSFWLDMDYFSFHHSMENTFSRKFETLFGTPRKRESEFYTLETGVPDGASKASIEENQYYADIAASVQTTTEEAIINIANYLHKRTGSKRLCMAGGVAYNSVANGRLLRETGFEELYIQPSAGDSGGALGAALYAHHVLLGKPRTFVMDHAYWGRGYNDGEIKSALEARGVSYEYIGNEDKLAEVCAGELASGRVLGWYQGRFEWGPRALGNRSIIADPRREEMKDVVNVKIKFREPFRPFAPSILSERVNGYFDHTDDPTSWPKELAKFMLAVMPVAEDKQSKIPAVSHLGTGRLQTVLAETNPRYHALISNFEQATGVPVIMNTSFNLRGEPIVTTPDNAMNTFFASGLDTLVLGNFVVRKDGNG